MKLIDLHCDTLSKLRKDSKQNLYKNNLSIDLNKLKKANSLLQCFALFDDKKLNENYDINVLYEFIYFTKDILSKFSELNQVKGANDILPDKQNYLLTLEDMGSLKKEEHIFSLFNEGLRMMSLTWNHENCIGYPNSDNKNYDLPLKPYGKKSIEIMNELGIIIDVSHLNDGGFYSVAEISKKPFIASHSNTRTLCQHSRNLTDEMIKIIADKGGIVGINFYSTFLDGSNLSKIEKIAEHIIYIRNKGGSDIISFGCDFDGIDCDLEIKDISKINKLIPILKNNGLKESDIEKLFYKNALRFLSETLPEN